MTTDDELLEENEQPEKGRTLRERLAEAEREKAEAKQRADALERRVLFQDAGLDPKNKQHAAFIKAYDGEMSDGAIADYVHDLGIGAAAQAEAPPPVPPDDRQAQERIADATTGESGPPASPDRLREIETEMAKAAMRGDNTALNRLTEEHSRARGFKVKSDLIIE